MTHRTLGPNELNEALLTEQLAALRTPPPDGGFETRLRAALADEAVKLRGARTAASVASAPRVAWRRAKGRWFWRVAAGGAVTLSASAAAAWWVQHVIDEAKRKDAIEASPPVSAPPARAPAPLGRRVVPTPPAAEPSPLSDDAVREPPPGAHGAPRSQAAVRPAVIHRLDLPERALPGGQRQNASTSRDARSSGASAPAEPGRRNGTEGLPPSSKGKHPGRPPGVGPDSAGQRAARQNAAKESAAERRESGKESRGRSGR